MGGSPPGGSRGQPQGRACGASFDQYLSPVVECHVATIRLQDDLAAAMCRFPDISEAPSGHWVTADRFYIP